MSTAEAVAGSVVTREAADPGYRPENVLDYLARPDHRVEAPDAPLGT